VQQAASFVSVAMVEGEGKCSLSYRGSGGRLGYEIGLLLASVVARTERRAEGYMPKTLR
jgi:hypothetical protein